MGRKVLEGLRVSPKPAASSQQENQHTDHFPSRYIQGVPSARGQGWVNLNFECFANSAWADGNLAEAAGQMGKMVEHPNQNQPNPGPQADGTPCTNSYKMDFI